MLILKLVMVIERQPEKFDRLLKLVTIKFYGSFYVLVMLIALRFKHSNGITGMHIRHTLKCKREKSRRYRLNGF